MGRETTKGKSGMKHWTEPNKDGGWDVKNGIKTIGPLMTEDAARTLAESLSYDPGENPFSVYTMGRWQKEQRA